MKCAADRHHARPISGRRRAHRRLVWWHASQHRCRRAVHPCQRPRARPPPAGRPAPRRGRRSGPGCVACLPQSRRWLRSRAGARRPRTGSEPASTLHALEVLVEIGAVDDPMVADAAAWIATIANPDAGVPFVMPTPPAIRMRPGWCPPIAARSSRSRSPVRCGGPARMSHGWQRATEWCWASSSGPMSSAPTGVKFALAFLDAVPDSPARQARRALRRGSTRTARWPCPAAPRTSGSPR